MFGEASGNTLAYSFTAKAWSTVAKRPYTGDHHAAEVIDGLLYVFGGLSKGGNKM